MTKQLNNPRTEQEVGVRLSICYPDPAELTKALAMDPDDSWPAGQIRPGRSLPIKFGSWRLVEDEVGIPDNAWYGEYVERCLRRLLQRIHPADFRNRLATFDPTLRPIVKLTGFAREFPNVHIPYDLLEAIVAIGAQIEEDFYRLPAKDEEGVAD